MQPEAGQPEGFPIPSKQEKVVVGALSCILKSGVEGGHKVRACGHKRWTQERTLFEVFLVHFVHLVHAER
jgi:hypothetical protein